MSVAAQLPALQVVVPLVAAPLCVLLRRDSLCWLLTVVVSWVSLAIAAALLTQTLAGAEIAYEMGGWAAPWGIEYRIDTVNAFVLLIVAGIGAVVAPYARASALREIPEERLHLFYCSFLLCLTGLLGITITGDAFNLFVFLEISSLSTYALISLGRDRRALTAAFQYLIMGTLGATFILIGVGLLYMVTGTLNMADLAQRLPALFESRTVRAAFAFLTVGISLKLALFPLHLWLPNAYAYAPSVVTAFVAGTATKVAVYVMLRFLFTIFGASFAFGALPLSEIFLVLALVAVFSASFVAIFQEDAKRLLAYSSVAQIGYIMLGISFVSATGLIGAVVHLFNHALMKAALFLALGCVVYRIGSANIDAMAGLGRRMPLTMAAFVIGGFSLIGIPLTVGFISKWYLVLAAIERGWWPVAVLVLAGSLLAVVYVWRVVEAAYFRPAASEGEVREAPWALLAPTWILIGANIYFGIDTDLTVGAASQAAAQLLGSGAIR